MNFGTWPTDTWTIHGVSRQAGRLIPRGGKFRLAPINVNGSAAFYSLAVEGNGWHDSLKGLNLYPLGWREITHEPLRPWKENDQSVADEYTKEADRIRDAGLEDPLVKRLEGTFAFKSDGLPDEMLAARIYYFPRGEQDGKDWIVVDIIAEEYQTQDGTAHGDP